MGDVTMGACFCLFGQVYLTLGTNPKSHFFGSRFFGKWAIICVFRVLDWFASISGAKIMAQKPHF